MNKKGETNFTLILGLFVVIIFSLALIPEIFNQQSVMTTKPTIVNEAVDISSARLAGGDINVSRTFTIVNAPSGWKVDECPIESVTYGNSSTNYVLTTDYTFVDTTGVLTLVNSTAVRTGGNNTLIDYTYCYDGYNTDTGSRSIAGIIGLFVVLALAVIVMAKAKDNF